MIAIDELLATHRKKQQIGHAENIVFKGVGEKDVYNITAPFRLSGKEVIAGRVESRESEISEIRFFSQCDSTDEWHPVAPSLSLPLQDPFVTKIGNELIIGGVQAEFDDEGKNPKWRTNLYLLTDFTSVDHIFSGPYGMKDIRLAELGNGQIIVLTRPQGGAAGRGKIGVNIIEKLSDLSMAVIDAAVLLEDQFNDEEWGGANEIYVDDGRVCVLGHIAKFDTDGDRHYYAMTFELDSTYKKMIRPQIIAERRDFLPGPAKRDDLKDVVFSGGLVMTGETAVLYAGISDAAAQKLTIKNPFK
ncbi:DUF1861 family protein [Vagococcus acidifermentans]|uniref:DUF1861 domain-containing protein n=1 Tax=Vagococcus acidifermentans TaxID=564710 RepID=A0A430B2Z1_9ENTE|nr:DUF1861 family protein [Vagococcus acidifermentans]RSU14693.1 hypothetical protein CBF27_01570 [Vagococcus acidifermentans]